MSDSQHNDCVEMLGSGGEASPLERLRAECDGLPFEEHDLGALLRRHTPRELQAFCQRHRPENGHETMLWLGESPELCERPSLDNNSGNMHACYDIEHCGGQLVKRVYYMGSHAYCFLDASDKALVMALPRDRLKQLWARYGNGMLKIVTASVPPPVAEVPVKQEPMEVERVSRKRGVNCELALYDHSRREKKLCLELAVRDRDQCISLNVELALLKQDQAHQRECHRLEKELMQTRHELTIKGKDNEVLQTQVLLQQQQNYFAQYFRNSATAGAVSSLLSTAPRKVASVHDWISDRHYQQDLSRLSLPMEPRYQTLYNDQRVTYAQLLPLMHVYAVANGHRLLLGVPMTYRYRLCDVLQRLRDAPSASFCRQDFAPLLRCCPSDYTVLLHWVDMSAGEEVASRQPINQLNVAALLFHCQAVLMAHELNKPAKEAAKAKVAGNKNGDSQPPPPRVKEKELVRVQLIVADQREFVPALGPQDDFYPHAAFYGPGTFVTASLGLRLSNPAFVRNRKEKNGTGSGKLCPLCWTMDRVYTQTATDAQHTHSLCSCPQLAMLSDNEAQVLLALRHACKSWQGNKDRAEKLRQKKFLFGKSFTLGEKTLLRHAIPDEMERGEHVAGLRLNLVRYLEMRNTVYALLKVQLRRSPLLANQLDARLAFLARLLLTTSSKLDASCTVGSLLLDADLRPFLVKPRTFSPSEGRDRLFFALQQPPMTAREQQYSDDVLCQQQAQFCMAQALYQQQQLGLTFPSHEEVPPPQPIVACEDDNGEGMIAI